jgi:hypothetical protein
MRTPKIPEEPELFEKPSERSRNQGSLDIYGQAIEDTILGWFIGMNYYLNDIFGW